MSQKYTSFYVLFICKVHELPVFKNAMPLLTWQPKVEHSVFSQLTGVKNRVIDDSRSVVVVGQPLVDLGDGRREKQTLTPKVTRAVNTTVIQVWYRRDCKKVFALASSWTKAAVSLEIMYYNPVSHKLCIINVWHCSYFNSYLNITMVFWQCWGTVRIVFTSHYLPCGMILCS